MGLSHLTDLMHNFFRIFNANNDALPVTGSTTADVSDRIGRLVGKITNYDVLSTGTLGELNATVEMSAAGLSTVGISVTGTWAGTIAIQGDIGDGTWRYLPMVDALTGTAAVTTTTNGAWQIGIGGFLTVRVLMFAYTSGTATVYMEGTSATAGVFLSKSLPTGTNPIGKLAANAGVDIGDVGVKSYTTVACGELQGSAAALQMPSVACKMVNFKARNDNAGNVYIGGAGVTAPDGTTDITTGLELDAGEETGWLTVANLNVFYRISDNAGDDLTFLALV